jgi:uncharacterized protein YkwD
MRHQIEVAGGAAEWARSNHALLSRCFRRLASSGHAPTLEQLQHDFSTAGESIDVRALAYSIPPELGDVRLDRLFLSVAALRFIPEAAPVLETWFLSLKLSCERWLQSGEAAYLSRRDVLTLSEGDDRRAELVSHFLLSEGWPLGNGHGGPSDEWWRRVTSGVVAVRDARSFEDLFDSGHGEERRLGPGTRLLRIVFRDPVGASVTGSLLVALLFWIVSGAHLGGSGDSGDPGQKPHHEVKPTPSIGEAVALDPGAGEPEGRGKVDISSTRSLGVSSDSAPATRQVALAPESVGEVGGETSGPQGVAAVGSQRSLGGGHDASRSNLLAPPSVCPGQQDSEQTLRADKQAMLCMINFAREKSGDVPLALAGPLTRAANRKSSDILRCGEFSHEACGFEFDYWIGRFGYPQFCVGENLAYGSGGFATVSAIFGLWLHSTGHRKNILGDYTDVGIGLRKGLLEGTQRAIVWTLDFGGPCQT